MSIQTRRCVQLLLGNLPFSVPGPGCVVTGTTSRQHPVQDRQHPVQETWNLCFQDSKTVGPFFKVESMWLNLGIRSRAAICVPGTCSLKKTSSLFLISAVRARSSGKNWGCWGCFFGDPTPLLAYQFRVFLVWEVFPENGKSP
jgi:hypothetical protein